MMRRAVATAATMASAQQVAQLQRSERSDTDSTKESLLEYASGCSLPTTWTRCTLEQVLPYNHDTSVFVFSTPSGEALNLPTCASILLRAPGREHGGGDAVRPYTPIAEAGPGFERIVELREAENKAGSFALLVKRYREWGKNPADGFDTPYFRASYRPAGAVSNFVHSEPAEVEFKHVAKNLKIQYPFPADRVNMIAVGAGVAPMIQALERLLFTKGDQTKCVLMLGNRSVQDILLRDTLDEWAALFPDRFKIVYAVGSRYANVHTDLKRKVKKEGFATTLDALQAPPTDLQNFHDLPVSANQAREAGWVGKDVLKAHAFPPHPRTLTFVCGLPSVYDKLCGPRDDPNCVGILADLGYRSAHVVKL